MEWNDAESWLIEQAIEGDAVSLQVIESKPEIDQYLRFVWEAFWNLTGDRQVSGMGSIGYIPFSAIDRYADRVGIEDRDHFSRFMGLIRRMDAAYIKKITEKTTRSQDKPNGL